MNKNIVIIGILSIILLSTITQANFTELNREESIIMNYRFFKPEIVKIEMDNTSYDRIIMKDAPCGGNPGEPSLPVFGAYILLPQGTEVNNIIVQTGERIYLGDGFKIEPIRKPISPLKQDLISENIINEDIYNSEEMFPGRLYVNIGTQIFRGYRILVLRLNPVQYLPASGKLFYYEEMTVIVDTAVEQDALFPFRGLQKDELETMNKVHNPSAAASYAKQNITHNISYDMVIITTKDLKNSNEQYTFQDLKAAHDSEGIITNIVTLEEIVSNPDYWVTGQWGDANPSNPFIDDPVLNLTMFNDTQAKIRNFIRHACMEWGIEYVLIGGDIDVIPARKFCLWGEYLFDYPSELIPSDLYYSCLDGNFNDNENLAWGEYPPDDGDLDLVAEVYVGRACTGNDKEVSHFVYKTLKYMNIDPNDYYLNKVLMAGEYLWVVDDKGTILWGGDHLDELIDGCNKYGYTTVGIPDSEYDIERLYDREWPFFNPKYPFVTGWPKLLIKYLINNDIHLICHDGHSTTNWNMKLYNNDIDELDNSKPCFIYSTGCLAGAFDNLYVDSKTWDEYYLTDDCAAEHFTVKTDHGAFAVIMNSRFGYGSIDTNGPSQYYAREFWDAVFNESIKVISKANQDSKEDNLPRIYYAMYELYYNLNLFGDPAIAFHDPNDTKSKRVSVEQEYLVESNNQQLNNYQQINNEQTSTSTTYSSTNN